MSETPNSELRVPNSEEFQTLNLNKGNLKTRTKSFAIRVIRLVDSLPRSQSCRVIGNQLLRAATSVGANYRAACRGRSTAEFAAKLGIVEEEADECIYWMELLVEASIVPGGRLGELLIEANEITAMIVASIRTARASLGANPRPKRKLQTAEKRNPQDSEP